MAATTGGAVKAYLESVGLGVVVHRDSPPAGTAKPYITVQEAVTVTPDKGGDLGDATATRYVTELVQVDIWQAWRTETLGNAESFTLPPAVARALQGATLPAAPTRVFGVTVDSLVRLLERETNTVHHAVTIRVRRVL